MATTNQTSSILVPIFTGENYDFWNVKMKILFRSQDLWDIIEEGFTIPKDTSTLTAAQKKKFKENKQKDSRALFAPQQAVDDTINLSENNRCHKRKASLEHNTRRVSRK